MTTDKSDRPWYKFYPKEFPKSLNYPKKKLYKPLEEAAYEVPKKTALVFANKEINYNKLNKLANQFACALQEKGIKKGDRVVILLPNCPQAIISFYGTLKAGAIPVPLNPLYTPRELGYFFNDSKPKIVVTLDKFYDKIKKADKSSFQIEQIVVTNIEDYSSVSKKDLDSSTFNHKGVSFKEFLSSNEDYKEVDINVKKDTAVIIYTGGTTGKPKGVMLTHFNIMSNAFVVSDRWLNNVEINSSLMMVPFFHIYAINIILNWIVKRKGKIILVSEFHTKDIVNLIKKYNIDSLFLVPALYASLWEYYQGHPKINPFETVNFCFSGSTSIPFYLWEKLKTMVPNSYLMEGYGLTETSPLVLIDPITNNYKKEEGAVGIPAFDTEVKIVDPDTRKNCCPGEVGEILIKGPQVFKGYWRKKEETEKVFTKDGWFCTGDVGRMNKDGIFFIEGRLDNMINVKGESVWPREVEKVFEDHPKVKEVAVIGVEDGYYGKVIKAFITTEREKSLSKKELIEYCKDKLVSYKIPRMVEFIEELPKSKIRKIQHHKLREREA